MNIIKTSKKINKLKNYKRISGGVSPRGDAGCRCALLLGVIIINKSERDLISTYLYCCEERLNRALNDCSYRYVRRDLDSVDLLEEIIAKERLQAFRDFAFDIVRLLKLDKSDIELANRFKIHTGFENCIDSGNDNKTIDINKMLG